MTTAVIGATGRVGSEVVRAYLRAALRSSRSFAMQSRPAASSANSAGCTSAPPAWTTHATLPRRLTESARCSSRWDRSGRGCPEADRDQHRRRDLLDRAGHPPIGAQHLGGLTGYQPASPLQHRPVRLLDRSAVLDDPSCDFLVIAARCGARGARLAHAPGPGSPVAVEWP